MDARIKNILNACLIIIIFLIAIFKKSIFENIHNYLLISVYLIAIGLIVFLIINFKGIIKSFKISKNTKIIFLIFILVMLILKFIVMPNFLGIYVDEVMRIDAAKNIATKNSAVICEPGFEKEFCSKIFVPIGWPFIMSLFFRLGLINNLALINFSIMIGIINIVLIFGLTYLLFKNEHIALFSSVVFGLDKLNLIWSNSANDFNAQVFFIFLTAISFLHFSKEKNLKSGFLFVFSYLFLVYVRTEMALLIIPLAVYFFLKKNYISKKHIPLALTSIVFILILLLFIPTLINTQEAFRKNGVENNFSFSETVTFQLKDSINNITNGTYYSLTFIIILIIGLSACLKSFRDESWFLISWFITFFFLYNLINIEKFYKFYFSFFIPMIIFISYGVWEIGKYILHLDLFKRETSRKLQLVFIVLIMSLIFYNPVQIYGDIEKRSSLLTKLPYLLEKDIPNDCNVLSGEAIIISSVTDVNAISAFDFSEREEEIISSLKGKCLLFIDNMYCDRGKGCDYIKNNYNTEEFKQYKNKNQEFTVYKLLI
ncbi:glycosyltransferase family 39 protein [Bacteroidota bacterium]